MKVEIKAEMAQMTLEMETRKAFDLIQTAIKYAVEMPKAEGGCRSPRPVSPPTSRTWGGRMISAPTWVPVRVSTCTMAFCGPGARPAARSGAGTPGSTRTTPSAGAVTGPSCGI